MNHHPKNMLALDDEAARYVGLIQNHLEKTLQGFIAIGRILTEAKERLGPVRWMTMINNELPFTRRTAEKLIKIAADTRLTNPRYASKLPPHWTSLHELTYLDDQQFEQGIADGTIRPDAERKEITALKPKPAKLVDKQDFTKGQNRGAAASRSDQEGILDTEGNVTSLHFEGASLEPAQVPAFSAALRQFGLFAPNLDDFLRSMVLAGTERRLRTAHGEFRQSLDGNDVAAIEHSFFELETKRAIAGKAGESDHLGLELQELYNYCLDLQIVTKYTPVEFLNPQAYVDLLGWRYLTGGPAEQEDALEGLQSACKTIPEAEAMLAYLVHI